MTLYWISKSGSRKRWWRVGSTRSTRPSLRGSPSSVQRASNSNVSFENPVNAGPLSSEIVRSARSGSCFASQSRMSLAGGVEVALLGDRHA